MNANELADDIENGMFNDANYNKKKTAEFIRQQQAEIESLKQIIDANNLSQKIGQFRKALTDEEIYKIANSIETIQPQHGLRLSNDLNVMDFARAILRKAQEK